MPSQRIFASAVMITLALLAASMLLQSPYQLWGLMAGVGLITGLSYKTGQRHVITGFGIGIALTLVREAITYGSLIEVTAPVYAAGYLFAVATTLSMRSIRTSKFFKQKALG